jgi:hypothetical protein
MIAGDADAAGGFETEPIRSGGAMRLRQLPGREWPYLSHMQPSTYVDNARAQ